MSQFASEIFLIFVAQIFTVGGSLLLWKMYQKTRPAEKKSINLQEQALQHQTLMTELTISKENLDSAREAFERERSKFESRIATLEEQVEKAGTHIDKLERDVRIATLQAESAERDKTDIQRERDRLLVKLDETERNLALCTQESLQAQIRAAVAERQALEMMQRFGLNLDLMGRQL